MPGIKDVKDAIDIGKKILKDEVDGYGRINLDPANVYFTGRDEILKQLHAELHSAKTTALSQSISGEGGVGKTQIAKAYAYLYEKEYKTLIWINSETPEQLQNEYAMIAQYINHPKKDVKEIKVVVDAVKNWLENHGNWLLIFDNVEHPDHVVPYLPQIRKAKSHVIITSRHQKWDRHIATMLKIEVYDPAESLTFLIKRTSMDEQDAAAELAEELGHFPLALEQAGAYICENEISIEKYTVLFKKHRLNLLKKGKPVTGYKGLVSTTWDVSFDAVSEIDGALDLLNLCAYLAPENIPLDFIATAGQNGHLNDKLNALAKNEVDFEEASNALAKYSLCEKKDDTLSFHRLVQEVVRKRISKNEQESIALTALTMMYDGFPFNPNNTATWEPTGLLMPHSLATVDCVTELRIKKEEAAELMNLMGWYLHIRSDLKQAKELCEKALMLSEEINGKEHIQVARRANYLGYILIELGELENARENCERALEIGEKVLDKDDPLIAVFSNNLGEVFDEMGKYEEANANLEKALRIDQKVYGHKHPNVAIRLNNLGAVLKEMGDLEGAKVNLKKALEIDEKAYGLNHPNVAIDLNNIGRVIQDMGDLEGAKANYERALKIFMKFYPVDHYYVTQTAKHLEMVLAEMKK